MPNKEIYDKVRLKPTQLDEIISSFKAYFENTDHLWIFGSRVDLQARGGDIDLYVETLETDIGLIYNRRTKFVVELCKKIGEQKVDVVIRLLKNDTHLAIYDEAIKRGIKLV
jgi:hypothetical protein